MTTHAIKELIRVNDIINRLGFQNAEFHGNIIVIHLLNAESTFRKYKDYITGNELLRIKTNNPKIKTKRIVGAFSFAKHIIAIAKIEPNKKALKSIRFDL